MAEGFYNGSTGVYTHDYGDKTFYGFKLNVSTGDLTIDVINDGTTTVRLPDDNYITDPNGYKNTLWSSDTITFSIGSDGHLLMDML